VFYKYINQSQALLFLMDNGYENKNLILFIYPLCVKIPIGGPIIAMKFYIILIAIFIQTWLL